MLGRHADLEKSNGSGAFSITRYRVNQAADERPAINGFLTRQRVRNANFVRAGCRPAFRVHVTN